MLEQLLDAEHEDELVVLEGDVVDAWGVGDRLPPRLLLHVLLEAGVQVADHGAQADDALAGEVDDEPEDAVGRRVVRAEVDLEDLVGGAELLGQHEHGGDRRRDPRAFVDPRGAG